MRLLDTNVIVYARQKTSPFNRWAEDAITQAVAEDGPGACVNAVTLAELCAETGVDESLVAGEILAFGVAIVPVPPSCAEACGAAYRAYRERRKSESGKDAPKTPLADFFIGAHALAENMELVTNDAERIAVYFPKVKLITPKTPVRAAARR